MARIRVVVVDDQEVVRLGLRTALAQETDMEVVGEAGVLEEAVRIALQQRPDVVLLDVKLTDEGYDGPEVCRRILAGAPKTAIIMLTNYAHDAMVFRSLVAGAKGYVIKDVELAELKKIIRAASRGASVLDPRVTDHVISRVTAQGAGLQAGQLAASSLETLSETDLTIIGHLSRGLSNKEIGVLVHLSMSTVRDHLEKISAGLGVHSRTAIVGEALRRGLI